MRLEGFVSVTSTLAIALFFTGCGSHTNPPSVLTHPASQSVVVGQTATFSVQASGDRLSYQWQRGEVAIADATAANYTTFPTSSSDSGAQFSVVVSNPGGEVASKTATLMVYPATDVLTYHNDNARTGQNPTEAILTPGNVNAATFGKLGYLVMDHNVDTQPLYASNVAIPGNSTHNLLIAATEHGTVYAIDADSLSTIWQVSTPLPGETFADDPSCQPSCAPIGVNPTPVIDRTRGPNGAIYLVAASQDGSSEYHQRLHALDLALGTELFGGPVEIQATYPGTGDNSDGTNVIFDPTRYRERASLLLVNGVIYTSWASHYDERPYTGWIIGYDASTLKQTGVLDVTPNGSDGAIWMSGAGPAADSSGNIYLLDANGYFDTSLDANGFPAAGDYGNAFLKLSTASGLAVADYFEMEDEVDENAADVDLGSGGPMLLPDMTDGSGATVHLAVGAGKDGNLYVVNRDSMGKLSEGDVGIYQKLIGSLPGGVFAAPAYFNNTIYYGPLASPILAFPTTNAQVSATPSAQTANSFGYPGATPSVSANGASNGIVWAIENGLTAVLHAYDASTLNELYNSNQASGGRDQVGGGNKFVTPIIVNGKVFVGASNGVAVYGLLPQ